MKRKFLSLILVFAMTVSLLTVGTGAVEPTYGDTAGHWAESSIERWSGHGIIQGSNGLFDPNGQLTCAQLATILAKLLKLPAAKDAGFTDNTADAWYYDAINRCAAAGILNGNGDGTVTPEAPITRERAIVMLGRALGIEPIREPDLTKYTDAAKVAPYAQGMVAAMIEAGIVGGVTADELAPQDNINRASTVTILDRAIGTYADKAGATVKADGKGIVLVVAENVKITGAPEGTKIVVADGATGLTVNGKSVSDDQTYIVPKTEPAKPSSSSSGGSVHAHDYTIFVTDWSTMTTVRKCSCGATQAIENSATYYIANDTDLKAFRNKVNDGNTFAGKTIQLTDSIVLKNEEWTPIGNGSRSGSTYTGKAFKGIFDGKDKSISNVTITETTANASDAIGLFGVVDGGTVKNVTLNVNINVANNELAGGAIGLLVNDGTAEKIHVTGNVKAADGVGGIVGRMLISGTIKECLNEAVVNAAKDGSGSGGIVGKAYYTATGKTMNIQDCENRGSITAAYCAGGIAGLSAANVSGCTNSGSVTAGNHAGGIVGEQTNYGAVSGNTNSADVIGKNTAAGGIIGWVRYQDNSNYTNNDLITVTGNTNSGSIGKGEDGTGELGYGGIVGTLYNQGTVSGNTNNAPTITGGTFAAGIVGGPQIVNDNKKINETTVTITNNVTTTTLDKISGTNTDLIAWKNDESFVIENNSGTGWTAKIGEVQYATLAAALAAAKDGDTVKLLKDITLTETWTPIGTENAPFKGTFDGQGYTITNLKIDSGDYTGLIGVLDAGTVKNVKFASVNISTTGTDVGAAVGRIINNGKVENVQVLSGSVSGAKRVGGVVGCIKAYGSVADCSNAATVSATTYNVGGIVGAAYYTETGKAMQISGCTNTGAVTSDGVGAGGIVGLSAAHVTGCENSAAVTGTGTSIGGIVGEQKSYGSVTNCTNSAAVTNNSTDPTTSYGTGGIIGWLRYHGTGEASAYEVSAIISVTGNSNSGSVNGGNDAGGIIGTCYNSAVVTKNANTAESLSATTFAAGIVGNYQTTETPAAAEPASNKLTFDFEGNTSSTAINSIAAQNKDMLIYTNGNVVNGEIRYSLAQ